ncbi:MAG: hypothetical protein ABW073_09170 [Acidimicrobiia bacterium]
MAWLGISPRKSYVDLDEGQVSVKLSWAFQLRVPLADVRSAVLDHGRVLGWGAHGWRGSWLVNGSSSGLVRLELEPAARARVVGIPVHVRVLRVSLDDPGAFVGALAAA